MLEKVYHTGTERRTLVVMPAQAGIQGNTVLAALNPRVREDDDSGYR